MPVLRIDNYFDAYRIRAQSENVHEMAARNRKDCVVEFANRRILDAIQPEPNDILIDIGCGDGTLLRMAAGVTGQSFGIVSTVEEQSKLESVFPELRIKAGRLQSLPIESGVATKIVCNAVFAYLQFEVEVRLALQEIARIACPGATIWIGEVPDIDEYAHFGMYRGNSMLAFFWHLLTHNGLRSFLGMIRGWLKAELGQEQIVLNSAGIFYATPEKMIAMAQSCGLRLRSYSRPKEMDQDGAVREAKLRYDYVFTV